MRKLIVEILVAIAACMAVAACSRAEAGTADAPTFTNPVIFADVPDVDLVRADSDYYMVSTTMHFMPGAPVMHSTDLVNWEIIGYVFDELHESPANDLDGGDIYGRGQWATSIKHHDGKFYVFFGTGNRSYLYTATDPAGPWTLQADLDRYYHDAALFFDDNGKLYLAYGTGHVHIAQFNDDLTDIDPDGVNVEIIPGKPEGLLEGSHLYKVDGKYYITLIWWPQGGIRTQECFRSDSIAGPYDEMKVILSDDLGFEGHGVAQGGFIDLPDGRWYALLFQDHEAVGRVPVLVECTWQDGWPILGNADGKVSPVMEYPLPKSDIVSNITVSDSFDSDTLGLSWQWNHNPDNAMWSLTERPGWLRLRAGKVTDDIFHARNTLTQRTFGPACSGEISIDVSQINDGDHAGLSAFCAEPGTVEVVKENGSLYIVMTDRLEEKERVELPVTDVLLGMDCDFTTDTATFRYSTDGGSEWHTIGTPFHMIYNLRHFNGNKFAIFYYSTLTPGGILDVDSFTFAGPEE